MTKTKTVLITGATSGIGLETAKDLVLRGYHVIGTSRSSAKEKEAIAYIGTEIPFIQAELSGQKNLRYIAEQAKKITKWSGIDVLINNAGTFYSHLSLSAEGVEKQFAVNAIAPLYLSILLYNDLKIACGRIINVSSSSHYRTQILWSDLQLTSHYGQLKAYKQTKLISVMLSREFNRRSDLVKTYMADPGLVATDIGFKNTGFLAKLVWQRRKAAGRPASVGAETSIYLATKPELPDELYWKDCKPLLPNKTALNNADCQRIWNYCKAIINLDVDGLLGAKS